MKTAVDAMAIAKDKVKTDPHALLLALQQRDAIWRRDGRLFLYQSVLIKQDRSNSAPKRAYEEIDAYIDERLGFLEDLVIGWSDKELAAALAREPQLKRYRWGFDKVRRAHRLPTQQETLLARFERSTASWGQKSYEDAIGLAPFGTVTVGGEDKHPQKNFNELVQNADRSIRERAYRQRGSAFKAAGDAFAGTLLDVARADLEAAKLRHFDSALEATYFNLFLTVPSVETVVNAFVSHAESAKTFQRAAATYIAKEIGTPSVAAWDLEAPIPGVVAPRLTIREASAAVHDATRVFGEEYTKTLDYILDPKNGRLDIVPGPKRSSGDTTYSGDGEEPVFVMEGYSGVLPDVVTLAHELAHAVHFMLEHRADVLPGNMYGVGYVTEGMAKVNELLVLDQLAKRATTPKEKLFYLKVLCDKLASVRYTTMYWAVLATKFEITVNRGVETKTIKAPADVHAAWMSVALGLADSYDAFPDHRYVWAATSNFFHSPRSYVQYLYAWLIATTLYERVQHDPAAGKQVVAFMKGGFTENPIQQIRTGLGIDLESPAVVEKALAFVEARLAEFEAAAAAVK